MVIVITVIKGSLLFSPTVSSTLKNLSSLYRRQGKTEAAEVLEEFSARTKNNNSKLDEERRNVLRLVGIFIREVQCSVVQFCKSTVALCFRELF